MANILEQLNSEDFADNKMIVAYELELDVGVVKNIGMENIVEKRENASCQHFSSSHKVFEFLKTSFRSLTADKSLGCKKFRKRDSGVGGAARNRNVANTECTYDYGKIRE